MRTPAFVSDGRQLRVSVRYVHARAAHQPVRDGNTIYHHPFRMDLAPDLPELQLSAATSSGTTNATLRCMDEQFRLDSTGTPTVTQQPLPSWMAHLATDVECPGCIQRCGSGGISVKACNPRD